MRARAFFRSSMLMLPGAIIGATYHPGLSHDLSSWRLVIDDKGTLFQDTRVWQWTKDAGIIQEQRQERVSIGADAVLEMLLEAERAGFRDRKEPLAASMTDMETHLLTVRFGAMDAAVEVYGAEWLAMEGNLEAKQFLSLWQMVHKYAPFPRRQ